MSPHGKGRTWTGHYRPEDDEGFDEGYFRRRPKSFCAENRRFGALDPGIRLSQISGLDDVYMRSIAMVIFGFFLYVFSDKVLDLKSKHYYYCINIIHVLFVIQLADILNLKYCLCFSH